MRNGVRGVLAGVAAAAVALGLAEFVAVFTGARSAPLVAVGGFVVDNVPEPLKQFAIDTFGTHDKTALLAGTVVLLAAFAALIGWLSLRNVWYGVAGIALFGVIGVAAALSRPDAGAGAAVPSLLGAAVAAVVLWRLVSGPAEVRDRVDRRRFLTGVAVVAGAAAASGLGGRWLATRRTVSEARRAVRLPAPASPAPAVPAGAELDITQLAPYVTSNRSFYRIDTALVLPQVDPIDWTLKIHGRVRNPITLTFDELLARPMVERYVTLACVSNEVGGDLIGNARWLGVPVKQLLDEAGPLDGADQVVARSADGWTCGAPTAVLRDGRDALLAVGMNGEPLPIQHGFPARIVVPGLYGYVSACKWVVELELTSFADFDAYWVPRGWSAQAPVKTQSRIDAPRSRNNLTPGPVTVAGVAWAQRRGIRNVEVRVDGGPWQQAALARTVSIDTWVQWSWRWDATPGKHRLQVRATDATGQVQPEEERPPDPDGATGWHSVDVEVG
jgi:DMSO/TMAO reductase YedYZ molybdopterin-dependent catalytic subunit